MNEIKNIQTEIKKNRKQLLRSKCFFALLSAHSLDKAIINAHCAKPTSLKDAQQNSDFINFIFQVETTPFEFMKSIDETSNKAIDNFNNYNDSLQIWPYDRRVLESFCKYYANTGWDISLLKCQIQYILYCGMAIQQRDAGNITEQELSGCIKSVAEAGKTYFSFKPRRIMRSFNEAVALFQNTEQKIEMRKSILSSVKSTNAKKTIGFRANQR